MQQYVSRRFVVAFMILVLLLAMVFGLVQCGLERKASRGDSAANAPTEEGSADLAAATPEATPTPKPSKDPYDAVKTYGLQIEVDGVSGDVVDNAYVRGIASLYEFDFGDLSGWTYTVNGTRPAVGAGACPLENGDVIVWEYTVNL